MSSESKRPIIALFSPGANVASETFIRAHRDKIDGHVIFYAGGLLPTWVNDKPIMRFKYQLLYYIEKKLHKSVKLTLDEFALKKSLQEHGPDVVLCEYGPTANTTLNIVRELGLPMMVYFHGYDMSVRNVIEENNKYAGVIAHATKLFVVSKEMQEKIIEFGAAPEKVIYNPCAPNDEYFKIEHQPTSQQVFLAAGRFTDKKAPYLTLLAFTKVLTKYPHAKLILAGDGELRQVCRDLAEYFDIKDNIELPGIFDSTQLQDWLSKAVAFVQHSVTAESGDREGTPVSLLEAMAAGVPVVATKHAGIKDIVDSNKSGYLVKEHDVDGMASKMCAILDNPKKARELGRAGQEFVAQNITMSIHINRIDEAIDEILQ